MKTCWPVHLTFEGKTDHMMITWLLLVSLVCKSTQDGNGQENGEYVILFLSVKYILLLYFTVYS